MNYTDYVSPKFVADGSMMLNDEYTEIIRLHDMLDSSGIPHGFRECMRVLKPDGVLIFKWSEYDIPAAEVWKALGEKPLFGHHSGKNSKTFWGCFMKLEEEE